MRYVDLSGNAMSGVAAMTAQNWPSAKPTITPRHLAEVESARQAFLRELDWIAARARNDAQRALVRETIEATIGVMRQIETFWGAAL